MAYADGKRRQVDRQFGATSVFGFGLAASLGIGAAVVVDLVQQRDASALYVINRTLIDATSLLGVDSIPLYGVMLLLMLAGGLSIFATEPTTLRGAFSQGFLALSALVTAIPADLGAPLQAPSSTMPMPERDIDSMFEPASLRGQVEAVPVSLQAAQAEAYQLRIQVQFPRGLENDVDTLIQRNRLVGKLWNPETGRRYNLFRNSGADMSYRDGVLRIVTQVEAADAEAELWVLVEASGYRITEESFTARSGANPIWNVVMEESDTPLLVQRLRHPYRF